MPAAAILGAGALSAGASIYASGNAADAAKSAAALQANAQNQATALQSSALTTELGNLNPFTAGGENAQNLLNLDLPQLATGVTPPVPMTQDQLEATPGYQFNLEQGQKAVTNAAAARGLGSSGAALKGAAGYATGLADSTYQNQFGNAQTIWQDQITNSNNIFSRLLSAAGLGENAAAMSGSQGIQGANNIANTITSGANAQAASGIAGANAISNGVTNASNALSGSALTYALLNRQGAGGIFGGGAGSTAPTA
jgi:hypothetical protein